MHKIGQQRDILLLDSKQGKKLDHQNILNE